MIRRVIPPSGALSLAILLMLPPGLTLAEEKPPASDKRIERPGLFTPLVEPPCSYVSTQDRKRLVSPDDPALAWIRGAHNGGAIPIRHFLSAPRVINDTYGLFFYDPDGGYVAAYKKDYGYAFQGWRNGVMIVKGRDGTLWSPLTGRALEGPQKGHRLERIPNFVTTWGYWLMLHPESTAYDLFDGKKYPEAALPAAITPEAGQTMPAADERLAAMTPVLAVEVGNESAAFELPAAAERACLTATVGGRPVAVLWYGPTKSAVAFAGELDGKPVTLYADEISPETAPFKDKETQTRWTMAGRAVDGPLRGRELEWIPGIQCRWYAWAAENPGCRVVPLGK